MKRAVIAASMLGAVFISASARAQDRVEGPLGGRKHSFESPQHFAFEFRFGPYHPNVDSDPSLHGTPYADTFQQGGDSGTRILPAIEFDWQALRIPHLGTLGPGFGAGYTSVSAKAPLTTPRPDGTTISAEDTSLAVFPFYAVAVMRFDVVTKELHVPLVPYVKGGLGFALWRASNTAGTSIYQDNTGSFTGKGHTWGTHVALGLALDLNPFDEYTARNFDNTMGVNRTLIFFELMRSALTGLGQSHALFVGDNTWSLGLTFEF